MIQQEKVLLAKQAWKPEFNTWDSSQGGRRKLTPTSCPLTSLSVQQPVLSHHPQNPKINK